MKKLSEKLVKATITFVGYLGYATTIRAFITSHYGLYWVGLTDGTVIIMTLVATIVYVYAALVSAKT